MFGYIYKTTNLINNKIYIGQHKCYNFDDSYFGSGKLLKRAIKKEGIKNFKCEIIDIAYDKKELDEKEIFYIKIFDSINSKIGYNLSEGGTGGAMPQTIEGNINKSKHNAKYWLGKHRIISNETKMKLSKSLMGHKVSEETRKKISNFKKGIKTNRVTESAWKKGNIPWNKGKKGIYSKETKIKMSNSKKLYYKNLTEDEIEERKKSINKGIETKLKKGTNFHSEKTKKKISESLKGHFVSEETKRKIKETKLKNKLYK